MISEKRFKLNILVYDGVIFRQAPILKSINKIFEKQLQGNPFLRLVVPDLQIKSDNQQYTILQNLQTIFSVSMNKIFETHQLKNYFFQFTIEGILLAIFVNVLNTPLLKCLISVLVYHFLQTSCLFTCSIMILSYNDISTNNLSK